jgi:type IV pilus secretin PilQ/predicted competence protein
MKKTIPLSAFASLFLLLIPFLNADSPGAAVTINRIEIQPGLLSARLVLETDGLLSVGKAYYMPGAPQTLVLDMAGAATTEAPLVPPAEAQLIKDIQVQKTGAVDLRLLVRLSERVPCRIQSDSGRTVVELNKIQRAQGSYLIDTETQFLLDRRPKSEIQLSGLETSQGPDSVSFRAKLSGEAVTQVFALENPPRLVVDLFDTVLTAKNDVWPVQNPLSSVQRARVGQFQLDNPRAITRMVFDLKEPGFYALDSDAAELTVSFYQSQPPAAEAPKTAAAVVPPAAPRTETPKVAPAPAAIPPAAEFKAEPKPAAKNLTAEAPCPPREPDTQVQEKKAAIVQGQAEKFKPKTIAADEQKYTGEIISLKFKDADLRDVVLYLAEFANLNVVFDPDVRGVVTCNLQDVPWDQALDIVLQQNKMGKTIEGNVLRIAPYSVLTKEQEDQRKLAESKEVAGPVIVKTVTLSYTKAKDAATLLRSKLSPRGEMIVDDRTNTLLLSDTKDKLDLIEKLITVVDTPTPQVSIEARIVEATSNFVKNLGIQWGFKGIADPFYGNQTSLQFPNKILVDGALIPQGEVTKGIAGPLGGYAINLPAPAFNTALGFSFANVLDTFRLDVALSALESQGDGRIISLPKITTQNNQQAEIIQGRQIPVQTVANFTVTVRYVNAALELRATPQITAEGTIIMMVEIQNNAADFGNLVNGIPPITTQSAKTTVMVPDGGTTVIGGIYRTEDSLTKEKVPFLNQIPVLGSLFKNYARTKSNRELLIFLTPRIVK